MSTTPIPTSNPANPLAPLDTRAAAPAAAPEGIAAARSTLETAPEPTSCLGQIASLISSLLRSIFSCLSSLWSSETAAISTSAAPAAAAQPPADILAAKGEAFLNRTVVNTIPAVYPRKVALLIKIDGRAAALFQQSLRAPAEPEAPDPLRAFCNEAAENLQRILHEQPALNEDSVLNLCVMDMQRPPEDRSPNTRVFYNMLTANLQVRNRQNISNSGNSVGCPADIALGIFSYAFSREDPDAELHREALNFFNNAPDARTGWIHAAP